VPRSVRPSTTAKATKAAQASGPETAIHGQAAAGPSSATRTCGARASTTALSSQKAAPRQPADSAAGMRAALRGGETALVAGAEAAQRAPADEAQRRAGIVALDDTDYRRLGARRAPDAAALVTHRPETRSGLSPAWSHAPTLPVWRRRALMRGSGPYDKEQA